MKTCNKEDDFLSNYVAKLKKICEDNLMAVILAGSASQKNQINGWSDIDLIAVLEKIDPEQLVAIGSLEKVGISVVGLSDWKKKIMNPKVKYGLTQGYVFLYGNVAVPRIKIKEISGDFKTLINLYHDDLIKCATRGMTVESTKKALKFSFIMCKVLARESGKNLSNYDECVKFAKKNGLDYQRLEDLNRARYRWLAIDGYKSVMIKALLAGEEIFQYGKKYF